MIVTLLIQLLYDIVWLITYPVRLLSDVSLDSNVTSSISTASSYLGGLNKVFPVTTLLTIFGLVLVVEGFILSWKGINWLIRKIPTIS